MKKTVLTTYKTLIIKPVYLSILFLYVMLTGCTKAQNSAEQRIYMDIGHGQKFWNDPADMKGMEASQVERVEYMTGEFLKNASAFNAELVYLKEEINADQLADCDLLFIHIPSSRYSEGEVRAITRYLDEGGSLFLVMDVDYWSTLDQTNVNDIIIPYGIQFGGNGTDTLAGGYTKVNPITPKPLKVTYHGGRIVTGGTPFCYNNQTEEFSFGTFMQLSNGGKLVVMGDGMVSLYMTSWNGVDDYQCTEFMHDVFRWLLE